jgi:hypothetical protein
MKMTNRLALGTAGLAVLLAMAPSLRAQTPAGAADRVQAIKQWLGKSKADLKNYQWMETTTVAVKGEVKSTKINNCYYDVNGVLQKEPQSSSPAPEKKRGLRGAIIADKTEEMTDYMKKAVALVKTYVPPAAEKIQASKDAGKMSIDMLPGGQNVRLNFHDYELPGDNLSISMDMATNRLLGMGVATYIDDPKDAVTLAVTMGTLPDGTGYSEKTVLDAKAKDLEVTVVNSGYRKGN